MIKLFTCAELNAMNDNDNCDTCPYDNTCSHLSTEHDCVGGYFREVPDEPVENKPYYKIWMAIEFVDEDKDIYKDVEDETIFCGDHFDTLEDAIAYRNKLIGTDILNPWSVLLRYPNSEDTYFVWVNAADAYAAVDVAKESMIRVPENTDIDPDDIAVILVLKGHVDAALREGDLE